jgi:hypothetical protein
MNVYSAINLHDIVFDSHPHFSKKNGVGGGILSTRTLETVIPGAHFLHIILVRG